VSSEGVTVAYDAAMPDDVQGGEKLNECRGRW